MKKPKAPAVQLAHRTLEIIGPVPVKKNRPMGRNFSIPAAMRADIDSLIIQMKAQWQEPPRSCPVVKFELHVTNDRCDSDGMVTTLLDCMQKAGVLVNDNTKHLRFWNVSVYDNDEPMMRTFIGLDGGKHVA